MTILIVALSGIIAVLVWTLVNLSRTITRMAEEQKTKDQLYQTILQHQQAKKNKGG